jgi:hypothetical protein
VRRLILSIVLAVLTLAALSVRAEFIKQVSVTGGSAQRLSTLLVASGYAGPTSLDELTIKVPDGNSNTLYYGSSSAVNASTGFPLNPGDSKTWRAAGAPIEASSIYLYVATTESEAVDIRER